MEKEEEEKGRLLKKSWRLKNTELKREREKKGKLLPLSYCLHLSSMGYKNNTNTSNLVQLPNLFLLFNLRLLVLGIVAK